MPIHVHDVHDVHGTDYAISLTTWRLQLNCFGDSSRSGDPSTCSSCHSRSESVRSSSERKMRTPVKSEPRDCALAWLRGYSGQRQDAGLLKDFLFFLCSLFGLLLNLFGLFLDGLGYLLHDDLFDLLLELLRLPTLLLNGFLHLLLNRFENLGNDLLRHLFVDLLCALRGFRFVRLLGDLGAYLCHRSHTLFQDLLRLDCFESLNQEGDYPGPAGLMAGPDARACVCVKVFVEQEVFAPVLIVPPVASALGGPESFLVGDEQTRHPSR